MMGSGEQEPRLGTELNQNHDRRLFIGLRHIDGLLAEIEDILHTSESSAVFPRYVNDLTSAEARTVEGYSRQLRQKLLDVVRWQGVTLSVPDVPTRRAVAVRIAFIEIAIEEMQPKYLRGSGFVSPVAEEFLYGVSGELREIASRMNSYLAESTSERLSERAGSLGDSELAQRLRTVVEIVGRQEMVQFRPALQGLIEDFKVNSYQIAVFGRVSSGKSSLLNSLLGTTRLPVGTTPVTAVPTRIEYAAEPILEVSFLGGRSEAFAADTLSSFASEEQNPKNNKAVSRLTLRLPLAALHTGFTFVDTPGIGSLAKAGTRESKAYLPSSDLALVLIDASGTLVEEDLDLLRLLDDAGIRSIVLLSKADLLTDEELQKSERYTADQLQQNVRTVPPIVGLSSLPTWEQQRLLFYEKYLQPLAEKALEHRTASLHLKLRSVSRRILLTLECEAPIADNGREELNAEQEDLRRTIHSGLSAFESRYLKELDRLQTDVSSVLEGTADRIASLLIEQGYRPVPSSEVQALVKSSIQTSVESLISEVTSIAEQIDRLAQSSVFHDRATDAREVLRDAPLFDLTEAKANFAVGRLVPHWLLRRRLIAFTKETYEEQLRDDLKMYAQRLQDWLRFCLVRLRETLLSVADQMKHEGAASCPEIPNDTRANDISALRNILHDDVMDQWKGEGTA